METSSISSVEDKPPQHQVFISFRGADLHLNFLSHLVKGLESNKINVFIDEHEQRGKPTDILLKRIEESKIALVIFSSNYTKSLWCVRELEKIKDCTDDGPLVAIPIFYKVEPSTVRELKGSFGADIDFWSLAEGHERNKKWKEAFNFISKLMGITINEESVESERVDKIVKAVKTVLTQISSEGSQNAAVDALGNSNAGTSSGGKKHKNFGNEQRLKELEDENSSYAKTNTDLLDRTFTNSRMDGIAFGIKKSLDKLKEKLDLNKISIQLGMKIGCLLLLFFVLQHIAYMMSTRLIGELGAIDRIVVNVPKMPKYIPAEGIENPKDRCTEFSTGNYGAKPESSSSDAKTNTDLLDRTFTNSGMDGKVKPPKIQVFINFRGDQLRNNFVGYLVDALRRSEINVFIDNQEQRGEDLNTLFKRIEDSGIAIVVFSSRYTESNWCLEELVKIKERVHQGLLKVLPIFYKVTPTNVKRLKGDFGDYFRDKEFRYESDEPMIKRWKEAIVFVSHKFALTFDEKSSVLEIDFIETIVKEVLKMLHAISKVESGQPSR